MKRTGAFYCSLAFTLLVCAFLIVPVVMSMAAGITENYFVGISSGITTRWIIEVWELYSETIFLSLAISIACLAVDLILGIPTAYVLAKKAGRAARIIEEFLVLPIAIPGLAIALALIIMYGGFRDFRSSWGFILVGHVLYTLPFMVRSVLAVLSSIDFRTLEEGARSVVKSFGASNEPNIRGSQIFAHVVLPESLSKPFFPDNATGDLSVSSASFLGFFGLGFP